MNNDEFWAAVGKGGVNLPQPSDLKKTNPVAAGPASQISNQVREVMMEPAASGDDIADRRSSIPPEVRIAAEAHRIEQLKIHMQIILIHEHAGTLRPEMLQRFIEQLQQINSTVTVDPRCSLADQTSDALCEFNTKVLAGSSAALILVRRDPKGLPSFEEVKLKGGWQPHTCPTGDTVWSVNASIPGNTSPAFSHGNLAVCDEQRIRESVPGMLRYYFSKNPIPSITRRTLQEALLDGNLEENEVWLNLADARGEEVHHSMDYTLMKRAGLVGPLEKIDFLIAPGETSMRQVMNFPDDFRDECAPAMFQTALEASGQLSSAVNIVRECLEAGDEKRAWLFFCCQMESWQRNCMSPAVTSPDGDVILDYRNCHCIAAQAILERTEAGQQVWADTMIARLQTSPTRAQDAYALLQKMQTRVLRPTPDRLKMIETNARKMG